ncbi:hypothetical protein C1H46_019893 [Malus baccata]|uniref:Uncharacterized protein n=1 Tax=Malus baccata TaxID=106549 RepID=A0A540M7I0_MALBA|nr:hypothetical protein C1H46_019893 [Malus baccata]
MFSVEFMCRVLALAPAQVFPTLPRSPWCLPFPTVSLGDFPEFQTGGWFISLGCRLSLTYGCAQETSEEETIDGGRRIGWLDAHRISSGESSGCFSKVLLFLGSLSVYVFFLCF